MATITFDTHVFIKKLKAVGFTEEQAQVFASEQARLIEDQLATKHDLLELETNLRRDIKQSELQLQAKMSDNKAEMIRWVIGVGMLQITLITALLLRLLPA
jgi:hypothetical protein